MPEEFTYESIPQDPPLGAGAGAGTGAGARGAGTTRTVAGAGVVGAGTGATVVVGFDVVGAGASVVVGLVVAGASLVVVAGWVAVLVAAAGDTMSTGAGGAPFAMPTMNSSSSTEVAAVVILCRRNQLRLGSPLLVGGWPPCRPHPSGVGPYCDCLIPHPFPGPRRSWGSIPCVPAEPEQCDRIVTTSLSPVWIGVQANLVWGGVPMAGGVFSESARLSS